MLNHKCPWCGNKYLITDKNLAVEDIRNFYQDHLNNGCHPKLGFTIGKIATSMYSVQKEFIV